MGMISQIHFLCWENRLGPWRRLLNKIYASILFFFLRLFPQQFPHLPKKEMNVDKGVPHYNDKFKIGFVVVVVKTWKEKHVEQPSSELSPFYKR